MPSAVNSRRNVISTRSPIFSVVGVDVGELDREAAAAVEVDDGEHDRRARRVRDPVDGERGDRALDVGHRRRLHVVDASPTRDTRAGGRWSAPLPRSFDPTNAYFHSSRAAGGRRRDARRARAGAGGSSVTSPRHERNLPYGSGAAAGDLRRRPVRAGRARRDRVGRAEQQDVGAVGERRAARSPGRARACSSAVVSSSAGVRRAGVADGRREVVDDRRPCRRRGAAISARTARACGPVTTSRSTWSGDSSAAFERARSSACSPSGDVLRLAEALLPHLRARVARASASGR